MLKTYNYLFFFMQCGLILNCLAENTENVFTTIYEKHTWGSESVSGPGSTLKQTEAIREYLPALIKELDIKTLLDAPCGDFNWMKLIINNLNIEYDGFDIVGKLIKNNQKKYSIPGINFFKKNIIDEFIPKKYDLILCRDCCNHLPFVDILKVIKNFKASGSKYLLLTTFVRPRDFTDIDTGKWRPINFQLPPFNFPEPLVIINERHWTERYRDKSLALWELESINI